MENKKSHKRKRKMNAHKQMFWGFQKSKEKLGRLTQIAITSQKH